tara:strand:+ start:1579 stop:2001 length:423 start_codon:yes stop_codon:yes gene_type:complete
MFYSKKHKEDMEQGNKAERDMYEPIKLLTETDDLKMTYSACRYDYISNSRKILVELKSRNCYKCQYPTTFMPKSKWEWLKNKYLLEDYIIYYVFKFKDKKCYYIYDEEDEFNEKEVVRKDRGRIEKAIHIEIPISKLTNF